MAADLKTVLTQIAPTLNAQFDDAPDSEGESYQLRLPIGDTGRTQDVMFVLVEGEDDQPLVRFFSIAGPLPSKIDLYNFLLKENTSLDYGSYGIMDVEGVDMLVMLETRTFGDETDGADLARAIAYVALVADEAEAQIASEDRF